VSYSIALIMAAALAVSYWSGFTPMLIPVIYGLVSLITFIVYARDKSAARKGGQRVPENSLHLLALFGGWPGALVAQQRFRHKTAKTSFRIPFWITVAVNAGALLWLHTSQGSIYLNTFLFALEGLIVDSFGSGLARGMLLRLVGFHA
jgi:uncharacterized membrane protein YsdA (DUF1294 family)